MSPLLDAMYARYGRPSIPPEKLLRGHLLQMLSSVRWELSLMEKIYFSILFRWFVGLSLDKEVWDATSFTKNCDRLDAIVVAPGDLALSIGAAPIVYAAGRETPARPRRTR